MLGLFKKLYTVLVYGAQTITRGYAAANYKPVTMRLDVQPLTPDEMMALPDGARTEKRIKTFGPDKLTSADEFTGTPGARLFYNGQWFECKSSVMWDHTLLSHYRSDFTILPERDQKEMPPP